MEPTFPKNPLLFEAFLPDGSCITLSADGTHTGLPVGTISNNHVAGLIFYTAGLTKKALKDGLIPADYAAKILAVWGCNEDSGIHLRDNERLRCEVEDGSSVVVHHVKSCGVL